MKKSILFFSFFLLCFTHYTQAQSITTVAGDSTAGYNGDNIPAISAELFQPIGIAIDNSGNIYIGDRDNNRIRKINTSGIITTIAGTGLPGYSGDDSMATNAKLHWPYGVAVDGNGNVYFADELNQRVRKINSLGIITTVAGTGTTGYNGDNIAATSAELNDPPCVAVDSIGNIYISDFHNNRIRMVNAAGMITTVAGTGTGGFSGDNVPATAAEIFSPYGIAFDMNNNLYIADFSNVRLRKVSNTGIITTIGGNGTPGTAGDGGLATNASLAPTGVTADNFGNIYIADATDNIIRRIDDHGIISTVAGTGEHGYNGEGELATLAELYDPTGVATNNAGDIYISDFANDRIRRITSTVSVRNVNMNNDIAVYPIPSNGSFTFNLSSNMNEHVLIFITNLAGEKIQEIDAITNVDLKIQLDVPTGVYILTAITAQGRWSEKLMVERT